MVILAFSDTLLKQVALYLTFSFKQFESFTIQFPHSQL